MDGVEVTQTESRDDAGYQLFTQLLTTLHHGFHDLTNSSPLTVACPAPRPSSLQMQAQQTTNEQENIQDVRSSRDVGSPNPKNKISRSESAPSQTANTTRPVDTFSGQSLRLWSTIMPMSALRCYR
eukprot:183177-Rhodomonas_salina.7